MILIKANVIQEANIEDSLKPDNVCLVSGGSRGREFYVAFMDVYHTWTRSKIDTTLVMINPTSDLVQVGDALWCVVCVVM